MLQRAFVYNFYVVTNTDNYFHLLGCWYALEMQICKNLYNKFLDIFFDIFTP